MPFLAVSLCLCLSFWWPIIGGHVVKQWLVLVNRRIIRQD